MENELRELELAIDKIEKKAIEFGLDFYPVRFEVCPADVVYTFGAYGMPTRFTHWSFGKAYYRMKTMYDFNLSRIYELVINANPSYAFLLEGNTFLQNKLVIAHVFAHCDFFKNNAWFAHTNRDMVESMAVSAARIREYEFKYGRNEVEKILDAILSIQEHIDPNHVVMKKNNYKKSEEQKTPYDDVWDIGDKVEDKEPEEQRKFPNQPEKDLVGFVLKHSHTLKDWQRDVVSMMREEMYYFWPQIETKIMNEGWASLWHARIMREMDLTDDETIDFARMNSGIIQPSKTQLNPYYLGLKIFEDIEKRWNNPSEEERRKYGRKGNEGLAKIFEVRETENDISFIRNYLTEDLVKELDLYLYQKVGHQWKVVDTDWQNVRDGIVNKLVNGGHPYLVVEDGDYQNNGHLYIKHYHEGVDLDVPYLEKTLPSVQQLWGKPIHLETIQDARGVVFSYDGKKTSRRSI